MKKALALVFSIALFFCACKEPPPQTEQGVQTAKIQTEPPEEDFSEVNYSKKSNILDPDTLKGDQKKVFQHFVKLTSKQAKALKPLEIKAEFEKIGILADNRIRFQDAYSFYRSSNTNHKTSCEQWQYFKKLAPKLE